MKRSVVVLMIIGVLGMFQLNFTARQTAVPAVRFYIVSELGSLVSVLAEIESADASIRKELYSKARAHYKHIEFFIEYISPREAKYFINGALVLKHDAENGKVIIQPHGLQVIEEMLFSSEPIDASAFSSEIRQLRGRLSETLEYYQFVETNDAQLLDMSQLQLHRLASLTLNGYDATYTLANITEAELSLQGIDQVIRAFEGSLRARSVYKTVLKRLVAARRTLKNHPDYNSFDRIGFITAQLDPLNDELIDFRNASGIGWDENKQALRLSQKGLFTAASFDLRYFSMYYNDTLNLDQQAELGKLLFFDPILSGNNERSCASCHNPQLGFAESLKTSRAFDSGDLQRNAPSLLNVAYQRAFFYDGRVEQLEEQVLHVVHNRKEMGSSLDECARKLNQSEEYRKLFGTAFSSTADITPFQVQKALAEYEKTLRSFNSRFDRFLAGDSKAIGHRERNGYNVFAGKALCGSCHFFPLFNGTVPPFYADSEYEVIGVPENSGALTLNQDIGRLQVTGLEEQRGAMKTPSVRNVEVTAPYMHNGCFSTLEDVVDFYHKGGGKGQGFEVNNQTLPFDSLQLSVTEKEDMILFMKSLTDLSSVQTAPTRLPLFPGKPDWNNRMVGGKY
ncbi:MAG: cytochrome c peroxidase [Bacteroidota bacterium]